jgi:hypothetical protein
MKRRKILHPKLQITVHFSFLLYSYNTIIN